MAILAFNTSSQFEVRWTVSTLPIDDNGRLSRLGYGVMDLLTHIFAPDDNIHLID